MLTTMLCVLLTISVFSVTFAIFQFFGNRELYNKTNHIPGPKVLPLIGCAYQFMGNSSNFIKQILYNFNIYVSPFRIVLGSRVLIFTKDPEQIKIILQSPKTVEKDCIYNFAKPLLGNGLATAEHKIWRVHRKMIQPSFNQRVLQSFMSIFQKNSILLTKAVEEKINGPEFKSLPFIECTSFNNICESSLGVNATIESEEVEKFSYISSSAFNLLLDRLFRVWLHSDMLFNLSQLSKTFNDYVKRLHCFADNVIENRRKHLQMGSIKHKEDAASKMKPTLDLLLEFSDTENKFIDEEIRDHVLTFIIAGSGTIAVTIDFVFLMLAHQSKVQDKVYEEIFNIYGSADPETNPVKYEDLQHLTYLERVIKETMRLFPMVPFIARQVTEDLDLGGCTVPKGCTAGICILGLHRDEKIWSDPLKFDPDRFLPEEVNKQHPCAFIPFSFGPRNCIGHIYAMIAMKVIVGTFIRRYIIIKDEVIEIKNIELKADAMLNSIKPISFRIEERVK